MRLSLLQLTVVIAMSSAVAIAQTQPAAGGQRDGAEPAASANPAGTKSKTSLNLTSLEQRLKDTKAIGTLAKMTLKKQVDELVTRFRDQHQGKIKTNVAELRKPYDTLLLKVVALLQDRDPALAEAVVASREEIWAVLSDPEKFAIS